MASLNPSPEISSAPFPTQAALNAREASDGASHLEEQVVAHVLLNGITEALQAFVQLVRVVGPPGDAGLARSRAHLLLMVLEGVGAGAGGAALAALGAHGEILGEVREVREG
jgi:hypothetical protein